jgi:hypothetical protein
VVDQFRGTGASVQAEQDSAADFFFCSSESAEGVKALRLVAAELSNSAGTHGLSDRLLVWRAGRWAEFGD